MITDLRLPLAVMVVFIHAFGNLVYVVPYEWMGRGQLDAAVGSSSVGSAVYDALRIFGSHVVTHIAVPTFFVISGYLF